MLLELQVHLTDLITRQETGFSIVPSFSSLSSRTFGLPQGAKESMGMEVYLARSPPLLTHNPWMDFASLGALHLDSEPCFAVQEAEWIPEGF